MRSANTAGFSGASFDARREGTDIVVRDVVEWMSSSGRRGVHAGAFLDLTHDTFLFRDSTTLTYWNRGAKSSTAGRRTSDRESEPSAHPNIFPATLDTSKKQLFTPGDGKEISSTPDATEPGDRGSRGSPGDAEEAGRYPRDEND